MEIATRKQAQEAILAVAKWISQQPNPEDFYSDAGVNGVTRNFCDTLLAAAKLNQEPETCGLCQS